MFTTSSKVVGESLQASHLSGKSGRSASTTPLDGLILIAAELLSSDSVFVFFSLGFYIFSYQCFSYPTLELLTIPVSAILPLSSYIALCYVLFHSPFSQLGNFHVWVKVIELDHIKIVSKCQKTLTHWIPRFCSFL